MDQRPAQFIARDKKIASDYRVSLREAAQDLYDDPFDVETATNLIELLLHQAGPAREALRRLNEYTDKHSSIG